MHNLDEWITAVWPGGYPVIYYTEFGETVCPDCAQKDDTSDPVEYWGVHYEGREVCADCGRELIGAYVEDTAEE